MGNTRALLDATASVTDTLTTDAWGVELAHTGATVDPFLAFGQWGYYRDTASRLYVRARHLRTDLGRWVSRDSIGFGGGDWNLYGYVGNAPVVGVDPSGEQCDVAIIGGGLSAICIPGLGEVVLVGIGLGCAGYLLYKGGQWVCERMSRPAPMPDPLPRPIPHPTPDPITPPGVPCSPRPRTECEQRYDEYKKQCPNASCSKDRPRKPGDAGCAAVREHMAKVLSCLSGRIWVVEHCDRLKSPYWDPKEEGHVDQICGVVNAMCGCAQMARKCIGNDPRSQAYVAIALVLCKRMKTACTSSGKTRYE